MRRARVLAVLAAVAVLVVAWHVGLIGLVADPERLRDTLRGLGAWGYVAFLLAFSFLQPVGVPGVAFVVGSTYVWSKPVAFGLSLLGSLGASAVGFGFARFVGRELVEAKMPPKLRAYDARIGESGFWMAIVLRFLFQMNPFVHGLFGVSQVRFSTYMLGSAVGLAPALAVMVYLGPAAIETLRALPPERIAIVVGLVVLGVGVRQGLRWRRKRRAAAGPAE